MFMDTCGFSDVLMVSCVLQQKARGNWKHWNELVRGTEIKTKKIREMLVPTMDTARYTYLMDLCISHSRSVHCQRERERETFRDWFLVTFSYRLVP